MNENNNRTTVISLDTYNECKELVLSNFSGNQRKPHSCDVLLTSGAFGFKGIFYFDNFLEFTAAIENMDLYLNGSAELKEDYGVQFIKLELSKLGHVSVSGRFEQHDDHTQVLSFGFSTDQTCLASFGKRLRSIIE